MGRAARGSVPVSGASGLSEWYPSAAREALPHGYLRRQPENTVLHQVVRQHLPAFLELASEEGRGIPAFAKTEIEGRSCQESG